MPPPDSDEPVGDEPPAKAARRVDTSPDGGRQSSPVADGSPLGGLGSEAQKQLETEKDDDDLSEASVGGHQVQDQPNEGALRTCPVRKHVLVAAGSHSQV